MSPPLVVAYALAGTVDIDLTREPLGKGKDGADVYLKDIWPRPEEVRKALEKASSPEVYRKLYSDLGSKNQLWQEIPAPSGKVYEWDPASTYIQEPPFFEDFTLEPNPGAVSDVSGARALAIFGDSVTTDHISPAGSIKPQSPAGRWLIEQGVEPRDFNSYGSRRGNDRVMQRGTFANVRIKNLMLRGVEGGETIHQPGGKRMSIFDAAMEYQKEMVPLLVFAGEEYGTGSSRDWAAKGTRLLGVRAVIAKSFERIHRSNLVGMGVLPCQFPDGVDAGTLGLDGTEVFDLGGIAGGLRPGAEIALGIRRANGAVEKVPVRARIDTAVEVDYYAHGGILPYVLRLLLKE
jgi:aconitate hydratase